MKIHVFIVKLFLDFIAFLLKLSRHNIYYLVKGPLKNEIIEASETAFAHQHIENAINIVKSFGNNKNGIILDVGGGQATTAQMFSKELPNNTVYVFEPIKSNFKVIEQESKGKNWILINKAVGNSIGSSTINIASRVTASSLLEMNENTEGYGDILKMESKEAIELTTLDYETPRDKDILILKLDVQGFEFEVLKGGVETLKRTKVIIIEINNHLGYKGAPTYFEIDDFLRNKNFELFDILTTKRMNNKLQDWDAIYVNKF